MPNKPQYVDFQTITKANFAEIMRNYQRLVYKWLGKTTSPIKHWDEMSRMFWEQVWVNHKNFDRSKGRLSTWLGWEFWGFYTAASRHGQRQENTGTSYEEVPLSFGDFARTPTQPKMVNAGLEPQKPDTQDDPRKEKSDYERESRRSIEEEAIERTEAIDREQITAKLSPAERRFIHLVERGLTVSQVAEKLGVSHTTGYRIMHELQSRIKSIAAKQPQAFIRTVPDQHWQVFFETLLQTTPIHSNDWSHAEELRTRNRWYRQRNR